MMPTARDQGQKGEAIALSFLSSKGYRIVAKNFRTKMGEIDIVAQDKESLVFVEVKTRAGRRYGLPEESITSRKMEHLLKAGFCFKALHPELPDLLRIDVVAVDLSPGGAVEEIRLLKNVS